MSIPHILRFVDTAICSILVNTMENAFLEFKWNVWPAYEWRPWLDTDLNPVVVPAEGFASLETETGVKIAAERDESSETGPVLCISPESEFPRIYHPMQRQHATLFRTFADIDWRDRDAIQHFAAGYGLLGLPEQDQETIGADGSAHLVSGESQLSWAREIVQMGDAVRLSGHSASTRSVLELTWLFERPHHLGDVQGRVIFDQGVDSARMTFEPRTLLAGMWLQMALSIARNKQFRACKFCGSLFEVSTTETGSRTDREFCSGSCKTKDYRHRKRVARQLSAEGSSLSAIAGHVSTNKATIKRWLAATSPTGKLNRKG